jgi:hypothetical protein
MGGGAPGHTHSHGGMRGGSSGFRNPNSGGMGDGTSRFHDSGDMGDGAPEFDNSGDMGEFDDPLPAGCVKDGPFKNLTIRIGPMGEMTPNNERCLTRRFNTEVAHEIAGRKSLSAVLNSEDFTQFRMLIERGHRNHIVEDFEGTNEAFGWRHSHHVVIDGDLHNIGHTGIGGEVI